MEIKEEKSQVNLHTGDISIVRDFVDVWDVVKAYYLLLEKGMAGELYNICTGIGHSLEDIITMLASLLEVEVQIKTDQDKIRSNDNGIIIGDNAKIYSHTGWRPAIILRDSLQDLIDYWKSVAFSPPIGQWIVVEYLGKKESSWLVAA
jgi:GDP-4-dehydro-6-deoxy-D-mannose reductase